VLPATNRANELNAILDNQYRRSGSIRLGANDQVLVDLRDSMR
jgi:hypothetical protein